MISQFLIIFTRLLEWFIRPRSIGVTLLKYGSLLLSLMLGTDYSIQLASRSKENGWSFTFGIGQGLPYWITIVIFVIAFSLIICGLVIMLREAWHERRRRLIVIELRGLHASPDSPAVDKVVAAFRGDRRHLLIDFRPQGVDGRVDPNYILEIIGTMKNTLNTLVHGADKRDIEVAIGGLAAVPALFLAGMMIDDESHVHLFDWDRNKRFWRALDGQDDLVRFLPPNVLPLTGTTDEAVLIVEASYAVNQVDIEASFVSSLPVIRLRIDNPLADRFWSEQKQIDLAQQFRDVVQQLGAAGVCRLHLVIATPASLSIRLGMCYDRRLFPNIIVYQFEKGLVKPFPWGLQMPTDGFASKVVYL